MRYIPARHGIGIAFLAIVLLLLGCPSEPEEPTSNAKPENSNVNSKPVEESTPDEAALKAMQSNVPMFTPQNCTAANLDDRIAFVTQRLESILGDMRGQRFNWKVEPIFGRFISVTFGGSMWGFDQGNQARLFRLNGSLQGLIKSRCIVRVVYSGSVPTDGGPGTTSSSTMVTTRAFEWTNCEYPSMVCPDGTCKTICIRDNKAAVNPKTKEN